ncbi:porin [Candidatus Pelagibacter sp.]|nr:porin [Candidatus Pelagibacter sp.]
MNNFKKIGMTALAASLVSTSVFAGEMAVTGSASLNMSGHSGGDNLHEATAFTMGNQLTFSGSGELDNGMTVSLSFVLDQGDATPSPFDGHSVTVSSDAMGTLKFSGEGGSSAATALDTTAAGDMWDNFNSNGGVSVLDSGTGDNSIMYTLPSMVDGLSASLSYNPQSASGATDHVAAAGASGNGAEVGYSATYTGVEGLSLSYGVADIDQLGQSALGVTNIAKGEQTAWRASYAYGPITVAATNSDYDITGTTGDQETSSYKISYTVSDAISIGYGSEDVKSGTTTDLDAEYEGFNASYTAGGMTISAAMQDGTNISNTTAAAEQVEYWSLGLSFAF